MLGAVGIALFALVARVRDETIALTLSSAAVLAALGAAEEAHRVGLETRAGTAFGAGFVAAVVVASLAGAATLERRALRPALVLALGLAIVPSVAGHALDPGLNRVNVVADVLHVLGAAAWVGALLGLVLVRDAPRRRAVVLAAGGVVVLGVTGVVRASFELLHLSQLWSTSYGVTLLVKTAILLAALAAGWLLRARIRVRASVELGARRRARRRRVGARSAAPGQERRRGAAAAGAGDAALAGAAGAAGRCVSCSRRRSGRSVWRSRWSRGASRRSCCRPPAAG